MSMNRTGDSWTASGCASPAFTNSSRISLALDAALSGLPAYKSAQEFLADLEIVHASLVENRGPRLAYALIDPLVLEVRTYGFHLQTLDIRQHAQLHAAALEEAFCLEV